MTIFKGSLAAISCICTVIFLYSKTQTVDLEERERGRRHLSDLSESIASTDASLLLLRSNLQIHYDGVTSSLDRCRAALGPLLLENKSPDAVAKAALAGPLEACAAALARKRQCVEDFESSFAVLRNSRDNLLDIALRTHVDPQVPGTPAAEGEGVEALLRDALLYEQSGQSEIRERLKLTAERLELGGERLPSSLRQNLDRLVAHARILILEKVRADDLVAEALSVPLAQYVDNVRSVRAAAYDERARQADLYRGFLIPLVSGLLLAVAGFIYNLRVKARELSVLLEGSRARNHVISQAADGILTIAEDGSIESLNPAAEALFGRSGAEALGRPLESLIPLPEGALRKGLGARRHEQQVLRQGETCDIELAISEVASGGRVVFTAIARDVTERKRVERLKNEFISNVSHELRTPLTSIRGSLALISSGVLGAMPATAKGMIDIAHKNTERLVRLVNDILDIQKIESGAMKFTLRTAEIMPLVAQALEAHRGYAQNCGVDLVLADELPAARVAVDPDQLAQVLANLLSNASKYSPRGGAVTVSVARRGHRVRVSVSDRGPGIPEEFKSRIFQKFAQAEASDTRAVQGKGTGLGLSISKAIMEALGGAIGFDSPVGQGSTFYIELPEVPVPAPAGESPGHRGRILICDDEADICAVLQAILQQEGYQADVAYSAKDALDALLSKSYVGMTLDLSMPGKDGLTFIRDLRGRSDLKDLPIVVVSAYSDDGKHILSGEALGVVDWLAKPIDVDLLREALKGGLEQVASERPRVLHLEDDETIRNLVATALSGRAELVAASSLNEAMGRVKSELFDLVILDLSLPDGSGLDLLPALRASKRPSTPVLVFSGQEVSPVAARHVTAVLRTSTTSNEKLAASIKGFLNLRHGQSEQRAKVTAGA